ncbi:Pls/PosA family non-ribosomal peptide synthetase [Streptomyces sp. FIT100]|uniref:Pls/PosA family non-ribosomal peptide synthetase n=1 Tax=Streptomyces sp. FIT100 TaxID=2837956 RepID=UPI0021C63189|nr:Pls/PosA family non-ribosomal peptide synthetase [Streptomyces sp. FIT100]UUN29185.1 peptide synthetase [Streptomyces sp. FIT100]
MVEKSVEVLTPEPDESAITHRSYRGWTNGTERDFAEVLADVVSVEQVSVDSHFFDDLGANSLVMAQFCARVRKHPDLPSVSMKDIYKYPTIRSLATALAEASPGSAGALEQIPEPPVAPRSTAAFVLCGAAQLLVFLGYCFVAGLVTGRGYEWVADGSGPADVYVRSLVFGGLGFIGLCTFPIVAKWILVGRWKPVEFPVWSLAYLRFWTVKILVHANPMIFLVGNPLYVLYLRALGAHLGKNVTILSRAIPVCTDLLTVGPDTVIRKEAHLHCYRAYAGRIQTGSVTIGRDAFIGEKTVLDINSSMGDGTQLGHTSALYSGQSVPDGEHWHGSPAQPTDIDYVRVGRAECGTLRRFGFGLVTAAQAIFLYIPLTIGGSYMLLSEVPALSHVLGPGLAEFTALGLYLDALILSVGLFFGALVLGFAVLLIVPRLMNLLIEPGKVYPLYGLRYSLHRAISRMTNVKFYTWLFGDSSYVVHYLQSVGYDLSRVEQTGSNFGSRVAHETPFLSTVGSGTMVADGLSIINADYSSTSFRVTRAAIGPHNFLGNNIAYPSGGRTGDNCLLATKVMIPLDGEVREGVGLLGSPSFEIPRTVERDARFDHFRNGEELRRSLTAKNRYNLRTMVFWLLVRWLHFFGLTLLGLAAVDTYGVYGQLMISLSLAAALAFTALYFSLTERLMLRFGRLRPQLCSIYDPYFWWHERLWKVPEEYLAVLNGTPFKNLVWRLLGVRLGKRVFDDGCSITERTLTALGDDCTLNQESKIQCHSQEDGTFKSAYSSIGAGCTLGVQAHVHYGVTMGDGAVLAPDSFLMKGEEVPAYARWGGNPATELSDALRQPAVTER